MRHKWRLPLVLTLAFSPGVAFAARSEERSEKMLEQSGFVAGEYIFKKAPFSSCHASTIAETPTGLVSAWFGGSGEGNKDVGIWSARKDKGAKEWTAPIRVEKEPKHPNWNPVLFQQPGGPLILLCKAGPNPGSWWGVIKKSTDGGTTWSKGKKLPKHELGFIHGPIRAKPILLADGRLLCGSSTEHKGWRVHFEWTSDWGKTWTQGKVLENSGDLRSIQPTILRYPGSKLQALCRTKSKVMGETWSTDGGKTWSAMTKGPLPNNNAGFDGVTMADGRQFLVYNHTTGGRKVLNLAVSKDGKNWDAAMLLEDKKTYDGSGAYAAYPAAIQAADGKIHIVYTWKRRKINYVAVDPAKFKLRPIKNGKWPD